VIAAEQHRLRHTDDTAGRRDELSDGGAYRGLENAAVGYCARNREKHGARLILGADGAKPVCAVTREQANVC
jgi:hypothetical protein